MPTSEKPPQVEKFTPLYEDFTRTLRPVVREVLNNDQVGRAAKVEAAKKAVSSIRDLTAQMFEVLDEPQKKEVATLIAKAEETKLSEYRVAAEARLRTLFPGEFTNKTYHSFVDAIAETTNAILAGYGKDLQDIPKTFGEILVSATRTRAREVLAGQETAKVPELAVVAEAEGTHEPEAPKAAPKSSSSGENKKLEEWKEGWFKGEIKLTKQLQDAANEAVTVVDLPFDKSRISQIDNLDDLREVSVAILTTMFGSSEVQQETWRTERIDYLIERAKQISQHVDKDEFPELAQLAREKAEFAAEMLRSARELYVFWWEGWMGKETKMGSSVDMLSIATAAGKFDHTGAFAFLMKQQPIAVAYHEQEMGETRTLFEKIHKVDNKENVWNMMGYYMRRSSGAAIYDGVRDFTVVEYEKIAQTVDKFEELSESDVKGRRALELEVSNAISEIVGSIRPNSTDYHLFLNHFIPWYLTARYRHKFKERLEFIKRQNEQFREAEGGMRVGVISDEVIHRLEEQFQYFNLGEIGSYSEHKRPDTWESWEQNLKIIVATAQDTRVRLKDDEFNKTIKDLGTRQTGMKGKNERVEAAKLGNEIDMLKQARKVYAAYANKPTELKVLVEQGLNFGMKMLSIYEPGRDLRTPNAKAQRKSHTDWSAFGLTPVDWEAERLMSFDFDRKLEILSMFLDNTKVDRGERAEIIKNNLIRTIPIDAKVLEEIHAYDYNQSTQKYEPRHGYLKQKQGESWFETNIFQEFISMDDLYSKTAGDTWMRFFDQSKFSANAFVIYEGYATTMRELIHLVFAKETSPSKFLEMKEVMEASNKCKHLIDTARKKTDAETGFQASYEHDTAWRLDRTVNAIEAYISALYIMSIAMYRKNGIRGPVAEQLVSMISKGVKDSYFKDFHFNPAKSEMEKQEDLEFSYASIESHFKMGNDYKLRYLLNLMGFEGNDQRRVWEYGFLANLNGRTPYIAEGETGFDPKNPYVLDRQYADNHPEMVDYDTILLMAGVKERGVIKAGEVNGYVVDQEVANIWHNYYRKTRDLGIDRAPVFSDLAPKEQQILVERAKGFNRFQGKEESFIRDSLNKQFAKLHDQFNNPVYGYFHSYFVYERNLTFVWDKVIDAYVQNTFDKDRRFADPSGPKEWPERKWNPSINYMRREEFKCKLLRRRKFAIDGGDGFNKFIVAQVIDRDINGKEIKPPRVVNPYDAENYEWQVGENGELRRGPCKFLHGVDEIESWLVGSGELGFGTDWRLTRLPIGYDWFSLLCLYEGMFSEETAKEKFIYSDEPEWETGSMRAIGDRMVLLGHWSYALNPELREGIYKAIEDPGGTAVLGLRDITKLKRRNGCTPEQVQAFRRERRARGVADLEQGEEKPLILEEKESLSVLDQTRKLFLEFPVKNLGEVGGPIGALFEPLKEMFSSLRHVTMGVANTIVSTVSGTVALGGIGAAITVVSGVPVIGAFATIGAFAGFIGYAAVMNKIAFSKNDIDSSEKQNRVLGIFPHPFNVRLPWWKRAAKNSFRILGQPVFALPFFCGTILTSDRNLRIQGRDSEVLIEGKEPIYDTVVSKKLTEVFTKELEFYKEKLNLAAANIDKRVSGR